MSKLANILQTPAQLLMRSRRSVLHQVVRGRKPSHCRGVDLPPRIPPRFFDMENLVLERSVPEDAQEVRTFLHCHFWPLEPSVLGLWVPLDSTYLEFLTYKYCTSVHRILAVERDPLTKSRRLVGVCVSNVVCEWQADELDRWASCTDCIPSRNRMQFCAHALRKPNLFAKYKVPVIFEIEVLAVDQEVQGRGVGTMLMRRALSIATELRYPLIQVVCTSAFTAKICERLGMFREWAIRYDEFVDSKGRRVFLPRRPHGETAIYIKTLNSCYQAPQKN